MSAAPPPARNRTLVIVLSVVGGALLLCCGGGLALFVYGGGALQKLAGLSEAERKEKLSGILRMGFEEEDDAAQRFLDTFRANPPDDGWARTSPGYGAVTPREKHVQIVDLIRRVMGDLEQARLVNANTRIDLGRQHTCNLSYAGDFANGKATITLTVVREDDAWSLLSYRVDSPLFLDAMTGEDTNSGEDDANVNDSEPASEGR